MIQESHNKILCTWFSNNRRNLPHWKSVELQVLFYPDLWISSKIQNTKSMQKLNYKWLLPISRSCHGCAATDRLDKDERILSLRRGAGRCSLWFSFASSLIWKNHIYKRYESKILALIGAKREKERINRIKIPNLLIRPHKGKRFWKQIWDQ